MDNPTKKIDRILDILKNGKVYSESIMEGQIRVYYSEGNFHFHEFQVNPYNGETRNNTNIANEAQIIAFFETKNLEMVYNTLN